MTANEDFALPAFALGQRVASVVGLGRVIGRTEPFDPDGKPAEALYWVQLDDGRTIDWTTADRFDAADEAAQAAA